MLIHLKNCQHKKGKETNKKQGMLANSDEKQLLKEDSCLLLLMLLATGSSLN